MKILSISAFVLALVLAAACGYFDVALALDFPKDQSVVYLAALTFSVAVSHITIGLLIWFAYPQLKKLLKM